MSILGKLLGGDLLERGARIVDDLIETPAERRAAERAADIAQMEVNKAEAAHRSVWVAGWRPFVGWICGTSLAYLYIAGPALEQALGWPAPALDAGPLMVILTGMLGLGGLRTWEKMRGVAK